MKIRILNKLFITALCASLTACDTGDQSNIADIIDNTSKHKGESITLDMVVDEEIMPGRGRTLRDYAGYEVKFHAYGPKSERLDAVIMIPKGMDVPNVCYNDKVNVTFICGEGDLLRGNVAESIKRP